MTEYDYEYGSDTKYCYPGTNVLKNKLNIHDYDELSIAERDITSIRIIQLEREPVPETINFEYLKSIHRFIFQDIYDWAGEIRTVNISKGVEFCRSEFIEENGKKIFDKINKENMKSMNKKEITSCLAHYLGEINAIHPFREGNGRVQRAVINIFAMKNGYYLNFSKIDNQEMIEASYHSFKTDDSKMIKLFEKIIQNNSEKFEINH